MFISTLNRTRRAWLVAKLGAEYVLGWLPKEPSIALPERHLGLLAAEFVWARRLMERIRREGSRVRDAVWKAKG